MENPQNASVVENEKSAFKRFAAKRMGIGILLTVAVLWGLVTVMGYFPESEPPEPVSAPHSPPASFVEKSAPLPHTDTGASSGMDTTPPASSAGHAGPSSEEAHPQPSIAKDAVDPHKTTEGQKTDSGPQTPPQAHPSATSNEHAPASHAQVRFPVRGMAFVNALIQPLRYELEERFWGWRPNDIIQFTDNVNNRQLGVLEVTRRSAVILAERVSRTGSTEAFDRNLENAMNWFMIKPEEYWFPSAESKYKDGLKELEKYFKKHEKRQATFYTRTDNLIPLLMVYEDLLGSCDENLVKSREKDGTPVSFFRADDYFYYAKGVADAMLILMEAIAVDFDVTIESRRGSEVLHHAIEMLKMATRIDPWIIFNNDLSGFFANHRANMAAPISHARFYLGVLIKTLST